jgi:creatinine amidohydrolase
MQAQSVFMADLTNRQIEDFLRVGGDRILIPVGALEQHGFHAPLATDVLIPQEIARRVALAKSGLVAPPISYGLSAAHRGFAGAAHISVETLIGLARDLCFAFAESGFRKIIFVNGHYTNTGPLMMACYDASPRLPKGTQAYQITYWEALPPDQLEEYLSLKVGLHANIGETSAVMAINPALVDLSQAKDFWPDFPQFGASPNPALTAYFETNVSANFQALPYGTWGAPSQSTVEKGQVFLDQIEAAVIRLISEIESVYEKLGAPAKDVHSL